MASFSLWVALSTSFAAARVGGGEGLAKYAFENGVDMFEVVIKIEAVFDFFGGHFRRNICIGLQKLHE
jgi:hypothetical protein